MQDSKALPGVHTLTSSDSDEPAPESSATGPKLGEGLAPRGRRSALKVPSRELCCLKYLLR